MRDRPFINSINDFGICWITVPNIVLVFYLYFTFIQQILPLFCLCFCEKSEKVGRITGPQMPNLRYFTTTCNKKQKMKADFQFPYGSPITGSANRANASFADFYLTFSSVTAYWPLVFVRNNFNSLFISILCISAGQPPCGSFYAPTDCMIRLSLAGSFVKLKALLIASQLRALASWNICEYRFKVVPTTLCPISADTATTSTPSKMSKLAWRWRREWMFLNGISEFKTIHPGHTEL